MTRRQDDFSDHRLSTIYTSKVLGMSVPSSDNGKPETALIIPDSDGKEHYYILNGDHHDEYIKLETLEDRKAYFHLHIDQSSIWSEILPETLNSSTNQS